MNTQNYPDIIELADSGGLTNIENYSGSTSSAYDDVSPHTHNSTPGSHDSNFDRHNQSTISSKKSKASQMSNEDNPNLTVDAIEKTLTEEKTSKVKDIISLISNLSDTEKLLLQLQFPVVDSENIVTESNNVDLSSNFEFIGSNSQNEHNEALTWITSHLEENKSTCLQKQEVYEDYKTYCINHNIKCLSTADFGKVMKKVFPNIKARRLGARGQSRYCYSGLKNRHEIQSPMLNEMVFNNETNDNANDFGKRDSGNANSEGDGQSTTSNQKDLSHVPEFELGPNIIIDSALVLLDYIKKAASNKNIISLKQAVHQLLISNQVETGSPHAMRLLSIFQQSEMSKKSSAENSSSLTKKEDINPSTCINSSQRSTTSSPLKRHNMDSSPIPNKISHYSNYQKNYPFGQVNTSQPCNSASLRHSNNYNQNFYQCPVSVNSLAPLAHRSTNNLQSQLIPELSRAPPISIPSQTQFLPANFSTPVKNSPILEIPHLNSPLLERNPSTTKKLELSNPKLFSNNSFSYDIHDGDSAKRLKVPYYDQSFYPQSTAYNQNLMLRRPPPIISSHQAEDYINREVSSPITMNITYKSDHCNDICDLEDIDTSLPLQRQIDDFNSAINYSPSPRIDSYNNYKISSNFSSTHSPNIAKPFLDTPGNSPTHNEPDLLEYSSNRAVDNSMNPLSLKRDSLMTENKPNLKTINMWAAHINTGMGPMCSSSATDLNMNRPHNDFRLFTGHAGDFSAINSVNKFPPRPGNQYQCTDVASYDL